MKILIPLSKKDYIASYVEAGADELYMGFFDEEWTKKFGKYSDINRMSGFGKRANPYSFDEILDVIKIVKDAGKRAFITMNSNGYSKEQIQFIENKYFPALLDANVDGVIMSDINTMISAVKTGLNPVASTMCAIYNSDIAKAYANIGVERMIFPRDLSLDEIKKCVVRCLRFSLKLFFFVMDVFFRIVTVWECIDQNAEQHAPIQDMAIIVTVMIIKHSRNITMSM